MANGKKVNQSTPEFQTALKAQKAKSKLRAPTAKESLRAGIKKVFGSGEAGRTKDVIKRRKAKQAAEIRKQTGM